MTELAYAIILKSKGRAIAAEVGEDALRQAMIDKGVDAPIADLILLELKVELGRRLRRIA